MANRYLCSVLDEMRECTKTLNFSYLLGLIVSKGRINYSQKTIYVDFKHKDAV